MQKRVWSLSLQPGRKKAMVKQALSLLLFLSLLAPLLPARPVHADGSGLWRTYTTAEVLLSDHGQAIAYRGDPLDFPRCDRNRRDDCPTISGLWMGTDAGFTYLNGREHEQFYETLPSPDIRTAYHHRW